jgi:hypothetical protein
MNGDGPLMPESAGRANVCIATHRTRDLIHNMFAHAFGGITDGTILLEALLGMKVSLEEVP